jgi:carbon-monoxide dehydrogenase large subunit
MLVEGQIHGGLAQGIAQALYEQVVYDDNGQLLTATLMDYAAPRASMLPRYELGSTVTPTAVNPLGLKGIGQAGVVASTPCIVNAVVDALRPLGVRHIDLPLGPERVWRAIQAARNGS